MLPFTEIYRPFHLHNELAYQIKAALNSRARSDVNVRIELSFDRYLFIGGLQQAGKLVKRNRGHNVYMIRKYSSLEPLLGRQWHFHVLNKEMDFCYVIKETVQFYLHKRHDIDAVDDTRTVDGGSVLIFHFVRGDGVRHN